MTEKELHKLNRVQILELFLEQCKRNEALEAELADVKAKLASKTIAIENSGSIAEASLKLTNIFEEAQKAADYYLANIKRVAGVEEEAETVDDSAESSEGAVAEVSEAVEDAKE